MRWTPALLVLALCGCDATDLCAGWDQTCIGLRVLGPLRVDQLEIELSDDVSLAATRTPDPPGPPRDLPVTTALHLRDGAGQMRLRLTGLLGGIAVGRALQTLRFSPGGHQIIEVELEPIELPDLGLVDGSGGADSLIVDAGPPDGPSGPPKRVFLLAAANGALGDFSSLSLKCTTVATSAVLGGNWVPVLGYQSGNDPAAYQLFGGPEHPIILPNGVLVATSSQFLAGPLLHPVNLLADGSPATRACIWTNFSETGFNGGGNNSCLLWTSANSGEDGTTRDPNVTTAAEWTASAKATCDSNCHIMCLEQ